MKCTSLRQRAASTWKMRERRTSSAFGPVYVATNGASRETGGERSTSRRSLQRSDTSDATPTRSTFRTRAWHANPRTPLLSLLRKNVVLPRFADCNPYLREFLRRLASKSCCLERSARVVLGRTGAIA